MHESQSDPTSLKRAAEDSVALLEQQDIFKRLKAGAQKLVDLVLDPEADYDEKTINQANVLSGELRKKKQEKSYLSCAFTDGKTIIEELCDEVIPEIDPTSLIGTSNPVLQSSAQELKSSKAWLNATRHNLANNETGRRQIMNLIINEAASVAQHVLYTHPDIDDAVAARHCSPNDSPWDQTEVERDASGNPRMAKCYLVAQSEVGVTDQLVHKNLALHGLLDYVVRAVRANAAVRQLKVVAGGPLAWPEPFAPTSIAQATAYAGGGKNETTMKEKVSEGQVLAQGASLCVLTKRRTIINVLSDGGNWEFYAINKRPASAEAQKPFFAQKSTCLNIVTDLERIIGLLVIATLFPAGDFMARARSGNMELQ